MMSVRTDLDRSAVFLSSPALIRLPEENRRLVEEAVGANRLFNETFNMPLIVHAGGKLYAKANIEELKAKINQWPLHHADWVQAQGVVAKYFQDLIRTCGPTRLLTRSKAPLRTDKTSRRRRR